MPLNLLSVASEVYPLIKTGGLADVAGALPGALAREGVAVTTLIPGYPVVLRALGDGTIVHRYDALMGGPAVLHRGRAAGLDLLVVDAPHLFARDGNPYLGPDGRDWRDNPLRFGAFSRVAADVASGIDAAFIPDVVQAHDWQAGLTAAYLHYDAPSRRPGVVTTVHNLAFQGVFPSYLLGPLGLPAEAYAVDGLEFHGSISFLKAALVFADRITTVSPTYASEIMTPEGGMGLDGLLAARGRDVSGILNGIDISTWNPETDPQVAARYSAADLTARATNKQALQRAFGLPEAPNAFLLGSVGRLTEQKGMDVLLEILPEIAARGAQLVLLGSGDLLLETAFAAMASRHPASVACRIGYDEALSHQIEAGVDAFIMPSRFEPCGLTQMYALRYGAVPIVARVGGLADTVIDANPAALAQGVATGFQFSPVSRLAIRSAFDRASAIYAGDRPAWAKLQRNAMATDFSWERSAMQYARLFEGLRVAGRSS